MIFWRLINKFVKVWMLVVDLIIKLVLIIKSCKEDVLLSKLGVVIFE